MTWSQAAAALDAAVADIFDETEATFIGVSKPRRGEAFEDTERERFTANISVERAPKDWQFSADTAIDPESRLTHSSGQIVVTALAAGWPWRPRIGDRVSFGGERFTIVDTDEDGSDRFACLLAAAA
ncbi:hypothetical protein [Afifella sp. IM 167]|uniref:hypothetical protein n=1 Tax=Afifella sp. IM 167 TaxID=2033586 RepID=UPI001CCD10D3|nr:hypothetical protein [Afifella sp. IM 167]MBZ8133230.1 hypothetical protein [Afifella sp. IM 167]